ncbi:hypothetical protein I7I51_07173 [Histoplasma capsulatum]|uniref:Uncharacterized protein n=1 Tax=Ajellomyces capsulatus TaxID=5037 RepID=A0A8A1MIJ9_AJECA|nr:hypothetical protein I7I51_07173 [Histoplasma capsulatum]
MAGQLAWAHIMSGPADDKPPKPPTDPGPGLQTTQTRQKARLLYCNWLPHPIPRPRTFAATGASLAIPRPCIDATTSNNTTTDTQKHKKRTRMQGDASVEVGAGTRSIPWTKNPVIVTMRSKRGESRCFKEGRGPEETSVHETRPAASGHGPKKVVVGNGFARRISSQPFNKYSYSSRDP